MSHPGVPHDVDNLTTSTPSSDMSKAEADKTVVKGIAHKYEGAVKHALGGLTRKPSLKESGEQERNEAMDQIQAAKEARVRLTQHTNPLHQNTMHESEKSGIPDAENVIQHEVDEHPNNPVNEYMDRNPRATDQPTPDHQEPEGQRDSHLQRQMDKRENPVLDPSIVRSQQKDAE
ncbi:hypothetical protein K450DRAFT_274658 [Umbelopsis ramanniana AG]|uniref:Uncharacterized protein n=1 Tax=Umbelopsis ramanniana AG TaxID=1314678 RepID=A0AAD5E351_UMBRA|nr:uncharacterized protein K450DRAFT_274658 [Umbelopsis ramanniana AG]KAI8576531.1 hypothetical protein K450DRAFT_274658 [Umbelopsis ramanniana AG]